jgi:hypothetical protein
MHTVAARAGSVFVRVQISNHSFNSAMANADVPIEIRQKLTASQDMNKHFTHLELQTVRRAVVSRLPGKAATHPNKGADHS